MILGFEFLIDHGADEVIEAEIVFLLTFFVEGSLRVGCAFELGFKTKTEVFQEGALLIRGGIGKFICIDEGGSAFCSFSKMLQMSEFRASRRGLFVVTLVLLEIDFRVALFSERTVGVMEMFLAHDQLMLSVKGS